MAKTLAVEPLGVAERRLAREEWRLVQDLENLSRQLQFLEAAGNAPGNGKYRGDSPYLQQLFEGCEHANSKKEVCNREVTVVKERRKATAAELERVREGLNEVRGQICLAQGRESELAVAIDQDTAAEIAAARRLLADVDRATQAVLGATNHLELLRLARRCVSGERILVKSPYIDRLLWGAFDDQERTARIDGEIGRVTAQIADLEREANNARDRAAEARGRLASKVRGVLQARACLVDELMVQAEEISVGMNALEQAVRGLVDLEPECRAPEFFRPAYRSDGAVYGQSAFRQERAQRVVAGVLEVAS